MMLDKMEMKTMLGMAKKIVGDQGGSGSIVDVTLNGSESQGGNTYHITINIENMNIEVKDLYIPITEK